MNARLPSVTFAAALMLVATAAVAAPHASAPMRATYRPATHVAHMAHFQPALTKPLVIPQFMPMYVSPWAAGFGTMGLMNLGPVACQSALPRTLGDLGNNGAGSTFAPVALSSEDQLDNLPTAATALSSQTPQSYCQQPSLELSTLNY